MKRRALKFTEYVLRGYAQLFLGSSVVSGAMILAGLFVASPQNGGWSLAGAVTVTAVALMFPNAAPVVRSGLFGVNGVLLGCCWALFPEVPVWFKATATIVSAAATAVAMVPVAQWLVRRKSRLCLFSAPSVLAVWLTMAAACQLGFYDTHFLGAWLALLKGDAALAKVHFAAARVSSDKARSYQHDGLGWACFFERDYVQAAAHFERAAALSPKFADAFDGLGWTAFRLGQLDRAKAMFATAVALDPWLADSWDGLGWIAWSELRPAEAQCCFSRVVLAAPLFGDAWHGLSLSARAAGNARSAEMARSLLRVSVARSWQFVSPFQLLCWGLFVAAIVIHSRISGAAVLCALGGLALASRTVAPVRDALGDANFLGNFIAITVALAGQYLRLNLAGIGWCAAAGLLLALLWPELTAWSMSLGLPLLWLPCNVILMTSLLLRRDAVPLDAAATNAETVRLWWQKKDASVSCWRLLANDDGRAASAECQRC